jgi:hypothetical protein
MAITKETCYVTPVAMTKDRSEVLQGTLDLMVLKTSTRSGRCTDMESRVASSRLATIDCS